VECFSFGWVGVLQIFFVFYGLPLKVFFGHRSPLTIVKIQQVFFSLICPDFGKLFCQAEDIVKAEVHSHSAERVIYVCGVTRDEDAAVAIAGSYALVHLI